MEFNDSRPAWLSKVSEDERLCWSFLNKSEWNRQELTWANMDMDPRDPKARAWALGPLGKLSELEELREARAFARMLIWEHAFGKDHPANPYMGKFGEAVEFMFESSFAKKVGEARSLQITQHAERDLLPLAISMGRHDLTGKRLGQLAKLRCCENMAPESSSANYIGALAARALSAEEEAMALMFLSPKLNPGVR